MAELPEGDPAPPDGSLPPSALAAARPFGFYVHVPFCAVRCGYCDFTTYTLGELADPRAPADYLRAARRELDLAAGVLGRPRPVATVFVGGGTPTMLAPGELVGLLDGIRDRFGIEPGAEVTVEANPDSVTPAALSILAAGGVTRLSLGMQSAVPHVLATLERTHDPAAVRAAVEGARGAGLAVSLDLIYGTPGESEEDWRRSLDAAIDLAPDHLSAYALTAEPGTRLGAAVRRGALPAPDPDVAASRYEIADETLEAAGFPWYEVSNWAATPARCRHNLGYWRGDSWWGIGPGAHSHVGGVRWWNVKHPRTYAARLAAGTSPAAGRETLTAEQRVDEEIMLGVRLRDGLDIDALPAAGRHAIAGLVADGLIEAAAAISARRVVLTRRGRLLADPVTHRLLGSAG